MYHIFCAVCVLLYNCIVTTQRNGFY